MTTQEPTVTPESQPAKSARGARCFGLFALGAVVVLGGLGYLGYWFFDGRYYESTDDAYINGDVVQVTNEISGTVVSLKVDDTQPVRAGQPLLELDPADAKVAEANAEADLARAVRQVRGLFAQAKELHAQIEQREQAERTADDDLKRRGGLLEDGAISTEELSHARDAVTTTRANLAAAREQLSQTIAQMDGTTIADHPQVLAAAAPVRNAALAVHRTELTSPVSGMIAKRSVQVGQRVAAGTPLLAVVPLDDVWVDANFKEVQLERMRTGQPVAVHGLFTVSFDRLPPHKIPAASGLSNFLRITAGSFATSLITTYWDRREALHQTRLADTISVYSPTYQQSLALLHRLGMNDQTAAAAMTQSLVGQSYLLSSLDLFYLSAWLCVALIPLCFLVRRPAAGGPVPVAAD
jgi:multidrug resistance efflux pump